MNEKFLKLLKEKEWICDYDGKLKILSFNIEDWPYGLDTENYKIELITPTKISGWVCGDWQDETTFNVCYENDDLQLKMYNHYEKNEESVKKYSKEILNYLNRGY